jgi:hypothetical protein
MSMSQSAPAATRISCSATITVLPDVDQGVQLGHELVDVRRVQADGGLVDDVKRRAALLALQLGDELDALSFSAGELGGRLTEAQISQPDLSQQFQRVRKAGDSSKNPCASSTVMSSTWANVAPVVLHLESLRVVARAMTGGAGCVHARHEQQLDAHESLALAGIAAARRPR